MSGKPKKGPREKDLTSRYLSGGLDEDRVDSQQRFNQRHKHHQANKTARTAQARADEPPADLPTLPVGQVLQVYSLFCEVRSDGGSYLCTVRRTLAKVRDTQVVVGDRVRFRPAPLEAGTTASGQREGVIEDVLDRATLLTRSDSFKAIEQHPIVANAEQMLIVASLWAPFPRWGLIDRMLIAARAGGLDPVVCLNKVDLADTDAESRQQADAADAAMAHLESLGHRTLRTSLPLNVGIDALREVLRGRITVLAGHSGVGKSSLVSAVQPSLDLRVGEVSRVHLKGKHTTTSARYYDLEVGGAVIDTPGVKLFGLWGVTPDNLLDFFPDVAAETAPPWRVESYTRIAESLASASRR
jgi:ribosome biogenesis GTPase